VNDVTKEGAADEIWRKKERKQARQRVNEKGKQKRKGSRDVRKREG
jgi:hypothetical protein